MFDVNSQTILWKKQMAPSDNGYRLRHIGRNLVIYSDERVAMVNSVGHVIFEVPLLGDSTSALEIFQEKGGDIFTIMVRDKLVTVYNGYTSSGNFLIGTSDILEDEEVTMFKPLELIYNQGQSNLVLLAQIDSSETNAKLAAFLIDHKSYESTYIGTFTVDKFDSTMRTKTNVILVRPSGVSEALNLFNLESFK